MVHESDARAEEDLMGEKVENGAPARPVGHPLRGSAQGDSGVDGNEGLRPVDNPEGQENLDLPSNVFEGRITTVLTLKNSM
jgi:hypothetical protein